MYDGQHRLRPRCLLLTCPSARRSVCCQLEIGGAVPGRCARKHSASRICLLGRLCEQQRKLLAGVCVKAERDNESFATSR